MATTAMLLVAAPSVADKLEAVHMVDYPNSARAKDDIDALVKDPALAGHKLTLYAQEFGDLPASHLVVEDFDSYDEYMDFTAKRIASPGWARYALESQVFEYYRGSNLVTVVDDHGAKRRSAGYLVAYLVNATDAAAYRAGIADLNRAAGNPGVMRLVAFRSGNMAATHAVLIGGSDFKAVNEYLDKLFASDAFAKFTAKVGPTRKLVSVQMYRRVGTWGD
ncbi:MAG TPA: hypothetical protein VD701_05260 [Steroidobacteraceae bacterium]|nr:hypothetical protein [Steroidobacteraceae bacterium]